MKRLLPVAAVAAAVLLMAGWFLTLRVPSGGVAVVESGPAGSPLRTLQPGFHLRAPGSRITLYADLEGRSSGEVMVTPVSGGEVPLRYEVSGRLDPARVIEVHPAMAGRTVGDFLAALTASLLRDEAARTDAVELISPPFRQAAAAKIQQALADAAVLDAAVTLGPPDDDTLMAAAYYLASRGEGYKVRQTVAEAQLAPDGTRSWKLQTAMGYIDESEKLFHDAEKNYLAALAIEPAAIPPMAQLVTMYSAVQDWATLRRILDAALTTRPDSPQHLNWMAMVMVKQEDLEAAAALLRKGLGIDPGNHVMMANLGTLYMRLGRQDEALEQFHHAVKEAPGSQQALFNLGTALAAMDRYADAIPYLERAAEAGSMTAPLARTMALALRQTGDAGRAAEYLKQAEALEAAMPRPPAPPKQAGRPDA